jgi:hypothetical protein
MPPKLKKDRNPLTCSRSTVNNEKRRLIVCNLDASPSVDIYPEIELAE